MPGKIVIGLGFGDEAKGLTTSWLCSKTNNPLVVRFNAGHNAGHTVHFGGVQHTFSSLGSGTLQGVPTYWSEKCVFSPCAFIEEYKDLSRKLVMPRIYVHPLCPVSTLFDMTFNKEADKRFKHGSVGIGFGATIERHKFLKIHVQDLFYPQVLLAKLTNVAEQFYRKKLTDEDTEYFMECAVEAAKVIILRDNKVLNYYNPIFEGAQGILLDMDYGFFPNVTHSNTTCKNAMEIHKDIDEVYYVTRTYLTRHGNGWMPNEEILPLVNNEGETNSSLGHQGVFKTAKLNAELLNYALTCDSKYAPLKKNLVITCMDQYSVDVEHILDAINISFDHVYVSSGPSLKDVELYQGAIMSAM